MQVAGVHRVGEVVVDEAVAARPAPHAQDAAPGRIGELRRQLQLARLRALLAREVDEDAVVRLDHRIAVDRLAALERAARHRRHAHDGAAAVERDAVVAAGDVVVDDLAARQPRAAMRAVVFEAMHLAGAVAPEHEMAPERLDARAACPASPAPTSPPRTTGRGCPPSGVPRSGPCPRRSWSASIARSRWQRSPPPCGEGSGRGSLSQRLAHN